MTLEQKKQELINNGYIYSHTAAARGYFSRKCEFEEVKYNGRYGSGVYLKIPRWDTTRFFYKMYFLKNEEEKEVEKCQNLRK